MTRLQAYYFQRKSKEEAKRLRSEKRRMESDIALLLSLKVRPSDNTPEAIREAKIIAKRYTKNQNEN